MKSLRGDNNDSIIMIIIIIIMTMMIIIQIFVIACRGRLAGEPCPNTMIMMTGWRRRWWSSSIIALSRFSRAVVDIGKQPMSENSACVYAEDMKK